MNIIKVLSSFSLSNNKYIKSKRGIYLLQVNTGQHQNKLTIKTEDQREWPCPGFFMLDF